jgi:hypothetical protein
MFLRTTKTTHAAVAREDAMRKMSPSTFFDILFSETSIAKNYYLYQDLKRARPIFQKKSLVEICSLKWKGKGNTCVTLFALVSKLLNLGIF